jgi:hypothetical protein
MNKDIVRLTNRHIAKLLDCLTPVNIPEIAISEIKKRFWYLAEDFDEQVLNKEQEDEGNNQPINK